MGARAVRTEVRTARRVRYFAAVSNASASAPENPLRRSPDEVLLERTLREAEDLTYVDAAAAHRLLLPFRDLVEALVVSSAPLEIGSRQLLGNVANQELDFELARSELDAALERARVAGLSAKQADVIADLVGPLLNLALYPEAAELIDRGRALAEDHAPDVLWRLLTRDGFLRLSVGDAAAAYASFAEAQRRQPPVDTADLPKRDAYYISLLQAGLAKLYTDGQDYERGVLAHEAVVAICERHGLRSRLPYHYLELGRARAQANDAEGAQANFRHAIELAGDRDRLARASALANLGYYAVLDDRPGEAVALFEEAEHHYRTSGTNPHANLAQVYVWRAEMARRRGRQTAEERLLEAAFEEARQGQDAARQALVCDQLASFYVRARNYEQAYQYRVLADELQQAVNAERNERRASDLELRYELEQRRREQELLRLRATEFQLKALRAQMNPHFIFNALNAIQESITSHRAGDAAAHLAQFAQLMRRSLEYSERSSISLEEEVAFLEQYLSLNRALRYRSGFTYEIVVDGELETDLIQLPAMLVQPYLENSLEHGIRLKPDGHIRLSFASPPDDEDVLLIEIVDNGIGRQAAARHSRKAHGHKSMGTDITQHRLALLNSGRAETEVRYVDLVDDQGAALGTSVLVTLPIRWAQ